MPVGYFSLILHAHLPYVRHPEYPSFLEEDWFYEAITEVYLPLIFIFQNLHEGGMKPRLAMNVSPPLCEMLADKLLEERYTAHLGRLLELAEKELIRVERAAREFIPALRMYVDTLSASQNLWEHRYDRNLINAFRELQEEGVIEIITCGATHGFLPLISTPEARRAQVQVAVANYRKHFGRQPRGIWLPECAYEPGVEDLLRDAGIEYFISDTHAILYGDPRPRYGVHAPVMCPNGVAVFARDVETSQQVWSADLGYPGNAAYREFYRDVGWDLPLDVLRPYLDPDANRKHLGLKYYRITGRNMRLDEKLPYDPALARRRAATDAFDFLTKRIEQARKLRREFEGYTPLVVSPYDAELYGHWWFEGPQFLDFFFRNLHFNQTAIQAITPGDILDAKVPIQVQRPTASSWGENGYYKVWINDANSWMYPYQHHAERQMTDLANTYLPQYSDGTLSPLTLRALKQLARELLLAQSSDWAFQIYQGTTVEYSGRRFKSHIHRFDLIAKMIETNEYDEPLLEEIESRDNIFAEIDPWVYAS